MASRFLKKMAKEEQAKRNGAKRDSPTNSYISPARERKGSVVPDASTGVQKLVEAAKTAVQGEQSQGQAAKRRNPTLGKAGADKKGQGNLPFSVKTAAEALQRIAQATTEPGKADSKRDYQGAYAKKQNGPEAAKQRDQARRIGEMEEYRKGLSTRLFAPTARDEKQIKAQGVDAWRRDLTEQLDTLDGRIEGMKRKPPLDGGALVKYQQERDARQLKDGALQKGMQDQAIPFSDRLRLGGKSVANRVTSSLPMTLDTIKQVGQNAEADAANPRMMELQKEYQELLADMDYVIRYKYKSRKEGMGSAEYKMLRQKAEETRQAIIGAKNKDPVSEDSRALQKQRLAGMQGQATVGGLSPVKKFVGSSLLSVANNAVMLPLAAVNPSLPLAAMGTQAGADKMTQLTDEGKSAGEALVRGTVAAGIETLTEKIPLENILRLGKEGGRGLIKNLLQQAGIEATEEGVGYALNYLADKAARDPNAAFSLGELAESMAGGALSGAIFGAGGTAAHAVTQRVQEATQRGNAAPLPIPYAPKPQPIPYAPGSPEEAAYKARQAAIDAQDGSGYTGMQDNHVKGALPYGREERADSRDDARGAGAIQGGNERISGPEGGGDAAEAGSRAFDTADPAREIGGAAANTDTRRGAGNLYPGAENGRIPKGSARAVQKGERKVERFGKEEYAYTTTADASTDAGLVADDYVRGALDKGMAERVDTVAKLLGTRVRFVDSVRGGTAI